MKKVMSIALVACMVLALSGCGGGSQETTVTSGAEDPSRAVVQTRGNGENVSSQGLEKVYSFNVGSSSTAGTSITKTFEMVQEKAPQLSDGKLTMQYFGASSLGSDKEMLQECVAGNLPVVVMTTASVTSTVPELAIFDMHCAFSSMDTLSALMEDPEFFEMLQSWFEKAGLHLIAWETQSSKLLASTEEINTIEDFSGYDMRTLSNKYHIAFWQAVGANTIQIDASELYLSVQQNLINGIEMNMASILSRKLQDVCGYVQETRVLPHMTIAVMNLDTYHSMTDADREWFDSFMSDVTVQFNEIATADNASGKKEVEAVGSVYKEFNQELFDDLKAGAETSSWAIVREDLGDEVVDAYLRRIAAIEGN